MGLVLVLLFALAAFAILLRYARLPRLGLTLSATALLVGLTGYVLQSHPGLPGTPVAEREARGVPEDPAAVATRRAMSGQFGGAAQVADFADTLDRLGLTREAVIAVQTELRRHPDNPVLWVALGNTIVAHGNNSTSPAAEYAFDHAAALSPAYAAPPFFKALALAKSGRTQEADEIWRDMLTHAPKDAPWRADIEARLKQIEALP